MFVRLSVALGGQPIISLEFAIRRYARVVGAFFPEELVDAMGVRLRTRSEPFTVTANTKS